MMDDLAAKDGGEDYKTFWEAFGRNLKVGAIEDADNRPRLAKLLRFFSSKSGDAMTSLDEYVGRMKDGQKGIYYMAADSLEAAAAAPFVERLVADGFEVLYLTEAIDEAVATNLAKYGDHELVDVTKEGLDLPGGEEDAKKVRGAGRAFCCCLFVVCLLLFVVVCCRCLFVVCCRRGGRGCTLEEAFETTPQNKRQRQQRPPHPNRPLNQSTQPITITMNNIRSRSSRAASRTSPPSSRRRSASASRRSSSPRACSTPRALWRRPSSAGRPTWSAS